MNRSIFYLIFAALTLNSIHQSVADDTPPQKVVAPDTTTGTQFMGGPFRRGMDCDKQPPLAARWPWEAGLKEKIRQELIPQLRLLNKNPALLEYLDKIVNTATNKKGRAELIRFKGTADLWHKAQPDHPIRYEATLSGIVDSLSPDVRETSQAILLSPFEHVNMLKQIQNTERLNALLVDLEKTIKKNTSPLFVEYLLKKTQPPLAWESVAFEIGIASGYAQPIVAEGKVYFCTIGAKHFSPNTDTDKIKAAISYSRRFTEIVPEDIQDAVIRRRALNLANLYADVITDEFSNIIGQPLKVYIAKKWMNRLDELNDEQKAFILNHLTKEVPTINIREALEASDKNIPALLNKLDAEKDNYDWTGSSGLSERARLADFLIENQAPDHLKVHCLDFKTGKLLWTRTFKSVGKDTNGGCGTPAYQNGKLYIHTKSADQNNEHSVLMCLNAENGEQIWKTKLKQYHLKERGFLLIRDFPISNSSPLLYNDILCVKHRGLSAVEAKSGKVLWQLPEMGHQFSTPTAYTVDGEDYVLIRTRTTSKNVRRYIGMHGGNQHQFHLAFKGGHPIDYLFGVHLSTGKIQWGVAYQDNSRDYDTLTTWQTEDGVITFDDFSRPFVLKKDRLLPHPNKAYQYIPRTGLRIGTFSDLRKGAKLIQDFGGWGRDKTIWWWMFYSLRLESYDKVQQKWQLASQYHLPPVFAYPNPTLVDGKCVIRMASGRLNCYDLRQK